MSRLNWSFAVVGRGSIRGPHAFRSDRLGESAATPLSSGLLLIGRNLAAELGEVAFRALVTPHLDARQVVAA